MANKIVVDPVTRIEGHLKIEVEVENGVVSDARLVGTMFRGLEQLVEGKDPRDVFHMLSRELAASEAGSMAGPRAGPLKRRTVR